MDMFSLLPESLLVTIVSFLPFKEAARTCILSKNWLTIWKSSRNIEFNELFFVNPFDSNETKEANRRVFLNFITHFIQQYQENFVDKFSLKVSDPQRIGDTIEDCVAFATQHGVKELTLDFSDPTWDENESQHHGVLSHLPQHVYGHASLETLKLYSCGFVMPDLLDLKALKDVSFGWMELRISTVKSLLSTCENLENLSLFKCWNMEEFNMVDENFGLKRLVIDKCDTFDDRCCYQFTAPNLTFFKYAGIVGMFQIDVRPNVMQEAELDFTYMPFLDETGDELCKALQDLSCVRVLTVCSFLLQDIPSGEESARVQCDMNVRHLIMKTQMHDFELYGFIFLLNSCAWLEKLTIDIDQQKIYEGYEPPYPMDLKKFWDQGLIIYECLRRSLKVVEVKGLRGTVNELQACNYLIRAASGLEQLKIEVKGGTSEMVETRRAFARLLLTVPKASPNLQISIA